MNNFFRKISTFIKTHKKTSIAIGIVVIIAAYFIYKNATSTAGQTTYVLGTVQRSTIVSSITGSGQVASDRQLDLKPQVSGNIVYVSVHEGQKVSQGDLVVELDATQAQKSVRDAEANLTSAKLSLDKIQEPADNLTLLQAQNALDQANTALIKSYSDGFSTVSNTYLDLPSIVSGVDTILHLSDANPSIGTQMNVYYYSDAAKQYENGANIGRAEAYRIDAEAKYSAAKASYDKAVTDYNKTSSTSDQTTIKNIVDETTATAKLVSDSVKSAQYLIQYYQDTLTTQNKTPSAKSTTQLSTLSGYMTKMDGHVSDLLSAQNSMTSNSMSVPEKQAALDKTKNGADPLDLQSAQLSVTKAQNSLQDAKDNLNNYFIRAPFNGTIAKLSINKGDPASSGTAVATMIASGQVVDIPLNEVDVSKVKVGDKATMTFDAIEGLTLTGKVASIDTVGTVTQGVVNYTVTIAFDSTDARVRPGMSTTASIITAVHPDVLTVSSSSVKSNNSGSYVMAFTPELTNTTPAVGAQGVASATTPGQVPVTTGISDDTNTEIVSGLTEGQQIVVRSIVQTTATATTSAPSLLGGGGARGATGGARGGTGGVRIGG